LDQRSGGDDSDTKEQPGDARGRVLGLGVVAEEKLCLIAVVDGSAGADCDDEGEEKMREPFALRSKQGRSPRLADWRL